MRCRQELLTPGKIWTEQNRINLNPVYQREAGVWSEEKKKLFIDSLLNGYDVPKIYLNAYPPGEPFLWAVIDGKQRLTTIISFMDNDFPLAEDFEYTGESLDSGDRPVASSHFRDFSERAKEVFKVINLTATVTDAAQEEEIENLFARLNNGEALNSAEQRNAIGGKMNELVRDLADRPFFKNKCSFSRARFAHREVSCKFLLIEKERQDSGNETVIPQLKKKFLDDLVKNNKEMPENLLQRLSGAVDAKLRKLEKLFDDNSDELRKQSYPQFFYLWHDYVTRLYAHSRLVTWMKEYIPEFTLLRAQNNELQEESRDPVLVEFGRLTQQGTNDSNSLQRRVEIMTRYFLLKNPETKVRDPRRVFNQDERYIVWLRAGKRCQQCECELASPAEMDADHEEMWAHGGETTLANARALCATCNRGRRAPVDNRS